MPRIHPSVFLVDARTLKIRTRRKIDQTRSDLFCGSVVARGDKRLVFDILYISELKIGNQMLKLIWFYLMT